MYNSILTSANSIAKNSHNIQYKDPQYKSIQHEKKIYEPRWVICVPSKIYMSLVCGLEDPIQFSLSMSRPLPKY